MPRQRKHFSPQEKLSILRRHLLDKVPVSTVCEEAGIRPSLLYHWQKQLFENGAAAFQASSRPKADQAQQRLAVLEAKLHRKDEVLAELMEEHVTLKKSLGEL